MEKTDPPDGGGTSDMGTANNSLNQGQANEERNTNKEQPK